MQLHFIPVLWVEQAAFNWDLQVLSFVTEFDHPVSRAMLLPANQQAA